MGAKLGITVALSGGGEGVFILTYALYIYYSVDRKEESYETNHHP